MPVCRHHFFKIQVYVLVDTDRRSSAFKRPSDIVLRWSDLTNPRADFFSFSSSSFFFFAGTGGGASPPPLDPLLEVSPVSLVVLAIRLTLFFIVTRTRARAKTHARSWWRVARAWDWCLYFGRTLLDMVTMCDLHVSIVVLAVGLALSLHCDYLPCLGHTGKLEFFFFLAKPCRDVVAICTS